jgi:hypothetical protein
MPVVRLPLRRIIAAGYVAGPVLALTVLWFVNGAPPNLSPTAQPTTTTRPSVPPTSLPPGIPGVPGPSASAPTPTASKSGSASPGSTTGSGTGSTVPTTTTGPSGGHGTTPSTPPVPTQADLNAALLTAADLPDGPYTTQDASSSAGIAAFSECPALNDVQGDASEQAAAAFSAGPLGPEVSEDLLQYSVPVAERMLTQFDQVADTCHTLTATTGQYHIVFTVVVEPFAVSGDGTVALRVTAVINGTVPVVGEIVGVRLGGTVIVLTNFAYPSDTGLTPPIVATAYRKLLEHR